MQLVQIMAELRRISAFLPNVRVAPRLVLRAQLLTVGGMDRGEWGRSTARWSSWSSCRTDR